MGGWRERETETERERQRDRERERENQFPAYQRYGREREKERDRERVRKRERNLIALFMDGEQSGKERGKKTFREDAVLLRECEDEECELRLIEASSIHVLPFPLCLILFPHHQKMSQRDRQSRKETNRQPTEQVQVTEATEAIERK